jgi:hypothetical protein
MKPAEGRLQKDATVIPSWLVIDLFQSLLFLRSCLSC